MSRTVDERVVSMQFDNRNFENNVQTSISTLDKLKQSLNLTGASKGLENVGSAAKNVDMSPLGGAIEAVHTKFSALEVMGVTALANITNSAVNAGKKIVSALTIDPIKTGFQEYETQINSVQTILANTESKGTTLQQVNSALDTLNTYADKTIYNFTEMTRNIGTFTAAGVDLDTSVSAIQGIANLAAVSGSSSQQASTAMYQLSQALSSGSVKLQDWNSIVNAGMGGQVFQDALKQTARAHGILIDQMIEDEGSFRESLKHGWISSEILTETLNQFTMAAEEGSDAWNDYKKSLMEKGYTEEQAVSILKMANTATDAATKVKTFTQLWDTLKESAQSGWSQSWEIIVGDFEEARGFLTDISNRVGDLISESANARNEMLSGGLSSGWKQLLNEGIDDEEGYKEAFKTVAKEHGVSIDDMIAAEKKLDDSLTDTEAFQKAIQKGFKEGSLTSDMLAKSVDTMADKMSKMSSEELKAAGYTVDNVTRMKELSKSLKDGSISMDEFAKKISRSSGRENLIQALWNAFDGLMSIIKPVKEALEEIFPPITGEQLYSLTESILKFSEKLKISGETADKIKKAFKGLFSVIDIIRQALVALFNAIKPVFGWIWNMIGGVLNLSSAFGEWLTNLRDSIKESGAFSTFSNNVSNGLTSIGNKFKEIKESEGFSKFIESAGNGLKSFGSKIKESLSSIGSSLVDAFNNGNIEKIGKIIQTALFSGVLLKIIKTIKDFTKNTKAEADSFIGGLKEIIGNASGVLKQISNSLMAFQKNLKAGTLLKIAIAIGILALSIIALSGIDEEKVASALGAITTLFIELSASTKIIGKSKSSLSSAVGVMFMVIGIAIAIRILAGALKKISDLNPDEIERGVLGIGGLAAVLVASMKILSSSKKKVMSCAIGMIAFAAAIKILASVCETFAYMGWEEIGKGLAGVGGLLAEVDLFLATAKFNGKAKSTAIGVILLAAGITILASVCKTFADMNWEEIGKGLAGVGGLLTEICAFTKLTGDSKKVISSAISITIMSLALKIIESVLSDLARLTWDDIARGLVGIGGAMMILMMAAKIFPKQDMMQLSMALPVVTSALVPLAEGLLKISKISWPDLIKSLFAVGVTMVILAKGLKAMEKTLKGAGALLIASSAIFVMAASLKLLSSGGLLGTIASLALLAGTFLILYAAAKIVSPLAGSLIKLSLSITTLGLSLIVLGVGLAAIGVGITGVLTSFIGAILAIQFLDWTTIVKGLVTLAAVFAIIGLAAVILKPATKAILLFSLSMLAIGTACLSVSLSIYMLVNALAVLSEMGPEAAASAVEALKAIIIGLVDMLPALLSSLFETIKTLIIGVVDVIIECAPKIADGILMTVLAVLDSLVRYIPGIVDDLMVLIIEIINGIAARMPELIQAVFNLIQSIFVGVVEAMKNIDYDMLLQGIGGIGIIVAVMAALSVAAALAPTAMIGVIAIGALIAELSLVLAAIGALSQIPGLDWIISEGGNLLQTIGTAIGQFIGGIVGGVAQGISSALPQIATELTTFMQNIQPFVEGAKMIDPSSMDGVQALVGVILALTAANVLEGLTSWLTGGSSLTKFGEEIAAFGPYIASYANSVAGVDSSVITASASAAEALTALANGVPRSGGWLQAMAGEQDIGAFGEQLVSLGKGLASFSKASEGIDPESIKAAAEAGKALTDLANTVPSSDGVAQWFGGEKSISKFGTELIVLGAGLSSFSEASKGIDPQAIIAASDAAKAIAEMTNCIPSSDGVAQWFTGEKSISKFGTDIIALGVGLTGFSVAIEGIDPTRIMMAAIAAKSLAEMTNCIPNEGGIASWFTGESSISKFGTELISLGTGLKGFSIAIDGIDPTKIIFAAMAAKSIAEMASYIPNEGGIASWFTGESSISKFGTELISLGTGLKGFSLAIDGIDPVLLIMAASAAKSIAEMASYIPNEGGLTSWFTGESSISKFGTDLISLGEGLKGFALSVVGLDVTSMSSAVEVARSLADLTTYVPNSGGVASWFTGEKSLAKFGTELGDLGEGLAEFAKYVTGIDADSVTAAANAAKTIAEMTNIIPSSDGVAQWFTGEKSLAKFGSELGELGEGISLFSDAVKNVIPENVTAAADAAKTIADLTNTAPNNVDNLSIFGNGLVTFGANLSSYFSNISNVTIEGIDLSNDAVDAIKNFSSAFNPSSVTSAVDAANKMVDMAKGMSNVKSDSTSGFTKAMSELGKANVEGFVKAFKDASEEMKEAGTDLMNDFIDAAESKKTDTSNVGIDIVKQFVSGISDDGQTKKAKSTCTSLVDKCATAMKGEKKQFNDAGKNLVEGFVDGIDSYTYKAEEKAKAMAKAAADAAKKELDEHSPSKVFYGIGDFAGKGFVNALNDYGSKSYSAGTGMAKSARAGLSDAISRISDAVNNDIDAQPTIRPVLDLTNVRSGANAIGGMLSGRRTISLNTNSVGILSASMAEYQNGRNSDDIVSSIDALRKELANTPRDVYNVNGISYDDGSNIATAVNDLIRAARIERRI